ncbi:Zn-ribbon domain-containing protein [Natribaculum luteum]|uniref:Zn-ribbon domain-containing protein n=1 Tax=Natribaculum luteum TaxID=1586232 RepID=A0ABD5P6L7_9EURY|nr:Zn-ribbon domain-containing protein [Natribaculum luteum]
MPHQCTNCGRTFADGSKEMLSGCPDCGGNKFQFVPSTSAKSSAAAQSRERAEQRPSDDSDGAISRGVETVREFVSDGTSDDRSWPSHDDAETAASDSSTGEFAAWPDSARPPEDRSSVGNESSASGMPSSGDEPSSVDTSRAGPRPDADATTDVGDGTRRDETEDTAQADARSEVVSSEELPAHSARPDEDERPDHGRVVSEPSDDRPSLEELREELNDQFESIKILRPGQYELNLMELYDREEYIVSLQEDGRYVINVPDSWRDAE